MDNFDVVVIGAGFAGAASAWHLTQRGVKNIIVLEQEELPGMHASGLNASMVRQFEEDQVIARCVIDGARFITQPPSGWEELLSQVGSLILFKHPRLPSIKNALAHVRGLDLESKLLDREDAQAKVPLLIGADFDHAVWTPTDGVVDINKLLWSYLNDAKSLGAELRVKQKVVGVTKNDSGSFAVETETAILNADCIVNAAGAWVGEVAQMAGASDIKLIPFRRHLYTTAEMEEVDPRWPFVWDIDNQYYFRPESGGLLLGPCDEEEASPGVPSTSHRIREMLAEKLCKFCPRLSQVELAKEWAGLRTFAPDRRFVIGEDPKLENFFWAAGLGGFGVTSSHTIGRLVAEAVLNKGRGVPKELRPERFSR